MDTKRLYVDFHVLQTVPPELLLPDHGVRRHRN